MSNTQERNLRRKLNKIGYSLVKLRTGNSYPAYLGGGYMIVDANRNVLVAGGAQWFEQLTLDEVEAWLTEE